MTGDITFVIAVIGVAAVLMVSNRVRFDIVALLVVLALVPAVLLAALAAVFTRCLTIGRNDFCVFGG